MGPFRGNYASELLQLLTILPVCRPSDKRRVLCKMCEARDWEVEPAGIEIPATVEVILCGSIKERDKQLDRNLSASRDHNARKGRCRRGVRVVASAQSDPRWNRRTLRGN